MYFWYLNVCVWHLYFLWKSRWYGLLECPILVISYTAHSLKISSTWSLFRHPVLWNITLKNDEGDIVPLLMMVAHLQTVNKRRPFLYREIANILLYVSHFLQYSPILLLHFLHTIYRVVSVLYAIVATQFAHRRLCTVDLWWKYWSTSAAVTSNNVNGTVCTTSANLYTTLVSVTSANIQPTLNYSLLFFSSDFLPSSLFAPKSI